MDVETYNAQGRELYDRFAATIANILRACIGAQPSIKVAQIQHRGKSINSLRAKLTKLGQESSSAIETVAKDLAGCRVIVYSNSDVTQLVNSRILFDNFDVDWTRTRIHQPGVNDGDDDDQFIANNYVVRLKPDRALLTEYAPFAGLACEIQIQTILSHAWSETAHDITYKPLALHGVGETQMKRIKARMKKIMQDYLLPAGYEFQKVLDDFQRLAAGKKLLDTEILQSISDAADNNERFDRIEQFEKEVLPLYDHAAAVYPDIRRAMLAAASAARKTPVRPIETPIGAMKGRTVDDVIGRIVGVFDHWKLRYIDIPGLFFAYVELWASAETEAERKYIRDAVGNLAKHEIEIWRYHGPIVQFSLLEAVDGMNAERRAAARSLVTLVCSLCLEPEMTGESSTSTTVSWSRASMIVTPALDSIRDRAIAILFDQFRTSRSDLERLDVIRALKTATRLPGQGEYSDALLLRVMIDARALIEFYTAEVSNMGNEARQKIESNLHFLYRRNRGVPATLLAVDGVEQARDALTAQILSFRDVLNAIEDFVIFKTLVGYESVYPYQWDEAENFDFDKREAFRNAQLDALVPHVKPETELEWFERLKRYASVQSDDLAMFPSLGRFIDRIAEHEPGIGQAWLARSVNTPLERFQPGMLFGLQKGDPDAARSYVNDCIESGTNLSGVMHFLRYAEPTDPDAIERALAKAEQSGELAAVYSAMETALFRPGDLGADSARRIFLVALRCLDTNHTYGWVEAAGMWGDKGLFAYLTDDDMHFLRDVLVNVPKLDYRAEQLIAALAKRQPSEAIGLFGARLAREKTEKAEPFEDDHYEAIPFDFHHLHTVLSDMCEIAFDEAFSWSQDDLFMSEFRGGRFIAILYPAPSDALIAKLSEYAQSQDADRQRFALSIMRNYEGQAFLHPILRDLVATLPADSSLLTDVRIALESTGVLHGEFGYKNALKRVKDLMADWLSDPRPLVTRFAEEYIHSVENDIALAQRSAEADIAMRRLDHEEPPIDPTKNDDDETK